MKVYITSYGIDTRYKEYMNSYEEIINLLKNKRVAIIPNAKLKSQDRTNSIVAMEELKNQNILAEIIDLDEEDFKIEKYNALYLSGGEPKYLMDSIINNGYYNIIYNFISKDNIIIGQSAGAMIMSKEYVDTSTGDVKILNNGFDFFNKMIIPHYDNLSEKLLKQMPTNIYKLKDNDNLIKLKNYNCIIDCHCHFVNLDDFNVYQKTSVADKYINIRSINHEVLVKPYDFKTFESIDNMYFTEAVNLDDLENELIRVENNLKSIRKIVGIKIYLGYQQYYANDDKIRRVCELANKYKVSMIFHCGECYLNGEKISYSNAKYIEELAISFQNINFIASHINWPEFDSIFSLCEKYNNIYTCFSGCLDAIDKIKRQIQVENVIRILNEAIKKYPQLKNKLMYGTDFFPDGEGFVDVSKYVEIAQNLNLSDEEKSNVLYFNCLKAYPKIKDRD